MMTGTPPAPSWLSLEFYARHFAVLLSAAMIAGFGLLIASAFVGRGGDLIVGDALGYFEYARSILAEHHLPIPFVKYPCGVSLVGIVGYAPAVWATNALVNAGVVGRSDAVLRGTTVVEQLAFCLPLIVLAYIALCANVAMLMDLGFAERVARTTVLFWLVATNIGFFILKEPAMSESATYSFLSLFYWGLVKWFSTPRVGRVAPPNPGSFLVRAMVVGFFLGMAGAVRQQNILHAFAVPLLFWSQGERPWKTRLRDLTIIAATSAVFFAIPWVAWYATLGKFQLFMYYNEEHFNWTRPNPWAVLFVWGYHGLFLWHPLFLLASIGLVRFLRRRRQLLAVWLVPLLLETYLICTWYWLSMGASFGHRGFFTVFPLLLPGMAAFIEWAAEWKREHELVLGLWALTAANAVLALLFSMRIVESAGTGLPPNLG